LRVPGVKDEIGTGVFIDPVEYLMLHQIGSPIRLEEKAGREIVRVEITQRNCFECLNQLVENDFGHSSAVREAGYQDRGL
jgi:hypothetical protein